MLIMTQEQKDLLLKDLSARLPYGVKFAFSDNKLYVIKGVDLIVTDEGNWEYAVTAKGIEAIEIKYVKPYLFPMSSMTEEQKEELENLGWNFDNFEIHNVNECLGTYREYVAHSDCSTLIDWLNRHHFDYRGLIKKGLAIDCTNLNIY